MKDIEINSDKYTVLAVVFFLALALLMLVSDLYDLARQRIASPDLQFQDYPAAIFSSYVAVTAYRDSRVRKDYPYGVGRLLLAGAYSLIEDRGPLGRRIS